MVLSFFFLIFYLYSKTRFVPYTLTEKLRVKGHDFYQYLKNELNWRSTTATSVTSFNLRPLFLNVEAIFNLVV